MSVPIMGNAVAIFSVEFGSSKTWSEVATITTAAQTVTVPGLKTTDKILGITKPTHQAGLGISNARVSAADTLSIEFVNPTAAGITPTASESYTALVVREERKRTDAVG
jgi:hypothetical protein